MISMFLPPSRIVSPPPVLSRIWPEQLVHLGLGRMPPVHIGPNPDSANEHIPGVRFLAQVAGDDVLMVLGVEREFLDAEGVRAPQQGFGRLGKIRSRQGTTIPAFSPRSTVNRGIGQRIGHPVSAPREIDDASPCLFRLLEGGQDGGRVVLHAVSLSPRFPDVEHGRGPRCRFGNFDSDGLAPTRLAAEPLVSEETVLAEWEVGRDLGRNSEFVPLSRKIDLSWFPSSRRIGLLTAEVSAEDPNPATGADGRATVALRPPHLWPVEQALARPASVEMR